MKIADAVIILFLLLGAVMGFKKGFIKTMVSLLGVFFIIIISYYLKKPVVNLMYQYLPFFNYGGLTVLNVFVYESLAFLFIYIMLSAILGIIINISGIVEKILKLTIVFGLLSKILGAIAGVLEMLLFIFMASFVLVRLNFSKPYIVESKMAMTILGKTPVVANVAAPTYVAFDKVYQLQKNFVNTEDKTEYNKQSLKILVDYGIITKEQAMQFVQEGKIKIPEGDVFILY